MQRASLWEDAWHVRGTANRAVWVGWGERDSEKEEERIVKKAVLVSVGFCQLLKGRGHLVKSGTTGGFGAGSQFQRIVLAAMGKFRHEGESRGTSSRRYRR